MNAADRVISRLMRDNDKLVRKERSLVNSHCYTNASKYLTCFAHQKKDARKYNGALQICEQMLVSNM